MSFYFRDWLAATNLNKNIRTDCSGFVYYNF